ALERDAKSAPEEMPVSVLPCQVCAGQELRHADSPRQSLAGIEQPEIVVLGREAVTDRSEFDEAGVGAGFAARPEVTNCERRDAAGAFKQSGVAQTQCVRCADFAGEVQSGIETLAHSPAGPQRLVALRLRQRTEARPPGWGLRPHGLFRQDRGEKPRVEA